MSFSTMPVAAKLVLLLFALIALVLVINLLRDRKAILSAIAKAISEIFARTENRQMVREIFRQGCANVRNDGVSLRAPMILFLLVLIVAYLKGA